MKHKLLTRLLPMLLVLAAALRTPLQAAMPRLVDDAGLLSPSEEGALLRTLDEISERQDIDIVIVTVHDTGGKTPEAFADDFIDYNGYRKDNIVLLISMAERDWYISTTGEGIRVVTDAGRNYIAKAFLPSLSEGWYGQAFSIFAESCDRFITQAREGAPYDVGNMPREPFNTGAHLLIALAAGFVLSLIITGGMKRKLTSVRFQQGAESYMRSGSMQLTQKSDTFLYVHVDKHAHPRPTNTGGSSTHTSSSGTVHGGGGGKF